ncbi:MAG: amino acid ABC transporter permease [Lachnospiraceae bacterium]|nr:amino acid ABC transporter permease [Lachnospiraceae bacterium]
MDWSFFQKYAPDYIEAGILTVRIGLIGILLSLLIGILASSIQYFKIPILRRIVAVYIELSRNTPLLVQLFFLYFGLPKLGIRLSAESCGIIGLAFLGGGYMAESLRSGLESVRQIQYESAYSLGFSKTGTLIWIIFPQALSVAFPSIAANVVFLLKETSVFSAIALADLMYVAKDLIGLYYQTTEALTMLVIAYLIILLPVSILASILERRLQYAEFGH